MIELWLRVYWGHADIVQLALGGEFHSLPHGLARFDKLGEISRRVMQVVENSFLDGGVTDDRKMSEMKWLRELPTVDKTVQDTLGRSAVVNTK